MRARSMETTTIIGLSIVAVALLTQLFGRTQHKIDLLFRTYVNTKKKQPELEESALLRVVVAARYREQTPEYVAATEYLEEASKGAEINELVYRIMRAAYPQKYESVHAQQQLRLVIGAYHSEHVK